MSGTTDGRIPLLARALGLFSGALLGLLLFAATAGVVFSGNSQAFDEAVIFNLRTAGDLSAPAGPGWLLPFARDLTALGGTPVLTVATMVLAGWFIVRRQWALLAILLVAVIGQTLLANGFKELFGRPRPDLVPHLVPASGNSFPSGHSTSAAAIYLTLAAMIASQTRAAAARAYVFVVAVMLALIVGASRVYLGVHYPTDVIGGLSFGAAWAAIVWIAARRGSPQAFWARPTFENQKP